MGKPLISIWFIIGSLLATYGVLILGSGICDVFVPPDKVVVMAHLHIQVWWGLGMMLFGLLYVIRFWPKHRKDV